MKNRKVKILLIGLCLASLVLICAGTLAYMFRRTEFVNNDFTPAQVSCALQEKTDTGTQIATQKNSIQVQNTGNIPAYIRIRFVSYWVEANADSGAVVAKASAMPEISVGAGWIAGANNTYYYQSPIAPGALTPELLAAPIILAEEDGYLQVLEVFAEAIQAAPADAAEESWQVSVDANGNIISAS